jgi:hypothetical protein
MMILASVAFAGSLLATDARARGGGGGFGGGDVGGAAAGRMAGVGHDRFDGGRDRFAGNGYYSNGLVCPYYPYDLNDQSYHCPF